VTDRTVLKATSLRHYSVPIYRGCIHINTSTSSALHEFLYTSSGKHEFAPFTYIRVWVTCKFHSYE